MFCVVRMTDSARSTGLRDLVPCRRRRELRSQCHWPMSVELDLIALKKDSDPRGVRRQRVEIMQPSAGAHLYHIQRGTPAGALERSLRRVKWMAGLE
jgi:hypothetical protein